MRLALLCLGRITMWPALALAILFNPSMLLQSWREWAALIAKTWDDPL